MTAPSDSTVDFSASNGEIRSLTSLRGIAAMAVVMTHFSATAQRHANVTIPSLVPHGYLAVDLFFVLSGFIMSYTYLAAFQKNGIGAFSDFLLKRVARIVPLNLVVLLLFLVVGEISRRIVGQNIIYSSDNLIFDVLANAFMLQGLGIGRNLNGPSWSISTEFAAYVLFPLFIMLIFSRRWQIRLFAVLVCVGTLCWLSSLHPRLGLNTESIGEGVLRCFAEFGLGMASYRLYSTARRFRSIGGDVACFALMGACLLFMLLRFDLPAVLLFPLLIISLALNKGKSGKVMNQPVFYFLGTVSFSLYLLHQLFRPIELALLQAVHPTPLGGPAALIFAFVASLSVVPFAWLAYCYVERPGRSFVRGLAAWKARGSGVSVDRS